MGSSPSHSHAIVSSFASASNVSLSTPKNPFAESVKSIRPLNLVNMRMISSEVVTGTLCS